MKKTAAILTMLAFCFCGLSSQVFAWLGPNIEVLTLRESVSRTSSVVLGFLESAKSEIEIPEGEISGNTGDPRNHQVGKFKVTKVLYGKQTKVGQVLTFESNYLFWSGPFKKGAQSLLLLNPLDVQLTVMPVNQSYSELATAADKSALRRSLVKILLKELHHKELRKATFFQTDDHYLKQYMLKELETVVTPLEALDLVPLICEKDFSVKDDANSVLEKTWTKHLDRFFD